jgi:hypothetical protein
MNAVDKTAVEKGIAEMIKPLTRIDKPVATEHRGIHELIDETIEMLEVSLATMRLARQRLSDFDDMQNRFYKGGKP